MDAFDKFWLAIKRFFFPSMLVLVGLFLIIKGVSVDAKTGLSQTSFFLYGGLASLVLGLVALILIVGQKIPTFVVAGLSILLLGGSGLFAYFNWQSIKTEMQYREDVANSKDLIKQGLVDIQKLQEEYEKNYNKFAVSFDSLIYFGKYDSTRVLVKAKGDIPTRPMTSDEIKHLDFNAIRDPKRAEIISEDDALELGKAGFFEFIREYDKLPVGDYLFSKKKQKVNRRYAFTIDSISVMRTIDGSKRNFELQTKYLEADSTHAVKVVAKPPYGPLKGELFKEKDLLFIGDLNSKNMKSSW